MEQHVARLGARQAPGPQVEHRLVVELADRRAVRALHIVRENLELRIRVDGGVVRQQQRAIGLLRVRFLRVDPDDDAAVEDAATLAGQDALVEFVARAVRHRVVERGVRVHQALAVDEIHAVHRAVGALALEADTDVVAHQPAAGRKRVRREHAPALYVHLEVGDVKRLLRLPLIRVEVDDRSLAHHDFGDGVGEVHVAGCTGEALRDRDLAGRPGDDQDARMRDHADGVGRGAWGVRRFGSGHDHDMNRRLNDRTLRHEDRHAIVQERGVECRERMGVDVEGRGQVFAEAAGLVAGPVPQAHDVKAFRQGAQVRQCRHELAVDNGQAHGAGDRHAGDERCGVARQSLGQRKLRLGNRRHVGKAPVFVATRRKPDVGEARRGPGAVLPHPCRRGAAAALGKPAVLGQVGVVPCRHGTHGHVLAPAAAVSSQP